MTASDVDSLREQHETASWLRRSGWLVVDPDAMLTVGRKPCRGHNCLTLVPAGRDLCHFCVRSA